MKAMRKGLPGRHADPIAVADAIVGFEYLRIRALKLTATQDNWLHRIRAEGVKISPAEYTTWMADAYEVLAEVARG